MTIEEIIAKANENPEFLTGLSEFVIGTDHGKGVLENYAKAEFDKKIGEEISKVHSKYDDDIFEILGERRGQDVKTYDFVKEKLKALKDSSSPESTKKVKELEAKLKEMQDAGEAGKHWKNIHEESTQKWSKEREEWETKYKALEEKELRGTINGDLSKGLTGLKFISSIPDSAMQTIIDSKRDAIIKNAKIVDGKVVYYKEDGTPLLNSTYANADSTEVWAEILKDFIDTNGGKGSGADPELGKKVGEFKRGADGKVESFQIDPSTFTTKTEFTKRINEVATKAGVAYGTAHYQNLVKEAYERYEVAKLPLQ